MDSEVAHYSFVETEPSCEPERPARVYSWKVLGGRPVTTVVRP